MDLRLLLMVVVATLVLVLIATIINTSLISYNYLRECNECKLFSRNGIIELHNVNTTVEKCPHCNATGMIYTNKVSDRVNLPLAPKLNIFKRIKIYRAIKNSNKSSIVDSQLERYQVLQQKKLNEMLDKGINTLEKYK